MGQQRQRFLAVWRLLERIVRKPPLLPRHPPLPNAWWVRTISVVRSLAGLLLLGWGLVRFLPDFARRTLDVMNSRALAAFGVGFLVVLVTVPAILLIVALGWLFWGIGGGVAFALFLFGLMGVLWSISPIFTGFWLGRRLSHNAGDLLAMVIGVLVLLL